MVFLQQLIAHKNTIISNLTAEIIKNINYSWYKIFILAIVLLFAKCTSSSEQTSPNLLYKPNIYWKYRAINSILFWKNLESTLQISTQQKKDLRQLYRDEIKVSRSFLIENQQELNKDTLEIRILNAFRSYLSDEEKFSSLLKLKERIDKRNN